MLSFLRRPPNQISLEQDIARRDPNTASRQRVAEAHLAMTKLTGPQRVATIADQMLSMSEQELNQTISNAGRAIARLNGHNLKGNFHE